MKNLTFPISLAALASLLPFNALAATVTVGPAGQHPKPCAAFAAASDGDTIEIDASGNYDGDVCAIGKSNLTIRGMNGRAKIDAAGKNSQGKAIWVIQGHDTTIENIELSGCAVPDKNGAGIRQEGANLTVRNCYFHDNENGILTGANDQSSIVIEYSEFGNNGDGEGYAHNMYIGHIASFTLRGCYSHHSKSGHLVKSRAAKNYILYNRLTGQDGTGSYELDMPNGGLSFVIGNVIQQGTNTENSAILAFAEEGASNPDPRLFVINNTFVNDRKSGTFINVGGGASPIVLRNNIFTGGGTVTSQANADKSGNFETGDPMFADAASFDYHLKAGSPCENAGVDPGTVPEYPLAPDQQYVHPAQTEARTSVGTIDIGAFELGGGGGGAAGSGGAGQGGAGQGGTTGEGGSGQAGAAGVGGGSAGTGGGQAGTAGQAGSAAGSAGTAGSTPNSDAGVAGAAGENPAGDSSDDGGCGCRTARSPNGALGALVLGAIALMLRSRRRHT